MFPQASLFPHVGGDLLHEVDLRPLFLLGQFVADFAGSEAALRTEAEVVVGDIQFGICNACLDLRFVLQLRPFGRNQSQYDFLVGRHVFQRFETSGTFVVVFQIERIDILLCEDERCHRVVSPRQA